MPNEDRVQGLVEVWRAGGISLSYGEWWVNNRTGYVLRYYDHASFLEAEAVAALVAAVTGPAHDAGDEEVDAARALPGEEG